MEDSDDAEDTDAEDAGVPIGPITVWNQPEMQGLMEADEAAAVSMPTTDEDDIGEQPSLQPAL